MWCFLRLDSVGIQVFVLSLFLGGRHCFCLLAVQCPALSTLTAKGTCSYARLKQKWGSDRRLAAVPQRV